MKTKETVTTENAPIRILVIAGPTAVGKTAFALEAAKRYGGEIVSCDSMQIYRYMDIGSAKPTKEEREEIPHHLVDCIDPLDMTGEGSFSAARYAALAAEAIQDIHLRGKLPVIVGGTGLYLNALLYEMDFGSTGSDPALRAELSGIAEDENGHQKLHTMLREKDPAAAERIHPNNVKKVIRALERLMGGEESLQSFEEIRRENPRYTPLMVGLTRNRQELYERINGRVLQMMEDGLVEEVKTLQTMGLSEQNIAMLGIGYKECLPLLRGECSPEETTDLIQKNTRHLAKRQLTWFRRYDKIVWFDISDYDDEKQALEAIFAWLDPKLSNCITEATNRIT